MKTLALAILLVSTSAYATDYSIDSANSSAARNMSDFLAREQQRDEMQHMQQQLDDQRQEAERQHFDDEVRARRNAEDAETYGRQHGLPESRW